MNTFRSGPAGTVDGRVNYIVFTNNETGRNFLVDYTAHRVRIALAGGPEGAAKAFQEVLGAAVAANVASYDDENFLRCYMEVFHPGAAKLHASDAP
jgi:hypothetical protein